MADLHIPQNSSQTTPSTRTQKVKRIKYLSIIPVVVLFLLVTIFGLMGVLPTLAQGTGPFYVTDNGSGTACSQVSPCSLETAVSNADAGAEIRVAGGTYVAPDALSPVLSLNQSLTLIGGYNASNWNLPPNSLLNQTSLDGQGSHRVISISTGVSPNLSNFIIENGSVTGENGAGIFIAPGNGQPIIHNNVISNNVTNQSGGGIYDSANSIIEYNEILNNAGNGDGGGGILVENDGLGVTSTIRFNTIHHNQAGSTGAGILVRRLGTQPSYALLVGNEIHNNFGDYGSGIGAYQDNTQITMMSNMVYDNQATEEGGGLYTNGQAQLWGNTFVGNNAATNGGGLALGTPAIADINNTIVAYNNGGGNDGIHASLPSNITGTHNIISDDAYNVTLANTNTSDPQFISLTNRNLHIEETSPARNTGAPTTPNWVNIDIVDIDEQPRPNPPGGRHDIGADEYYEDFADFTFLPAIDSNLVERGAVETFVHYLDNTGTVSDTYSFACSSDIFTVTHCSAPVQILAGDNPVQITTSVEIPADRTPYEVGRTIITATSTVSPTLSENAIVLSTIAPHPGISFTPNYSRTELPGDIITLTHILTNTGDAFENFVISEINDPDDSNWGELLPSDPYTIGIGAGEVRSVQVRVTIPDFAPQGLANYVHLQAASSFDPSISDTIVNTITAKATTGTRYVVSGGENDNNNCTQSANPCSTVGHAVGQAVLGDEVRIGSGTFTESSINVNDTIHISGGWLNFRDDGQGEEPDPTRTTINANGNGPVFIINAGDPTIGVLTIQNGQNLNGGGVFVGANTHPEFANVIFDNNAATNQGGALYVNGNGTVLTVRQSKFTNNNTSNSGGALYMNGGILELSQTQFMTNTTGNSGGGALTISNNGQLSAQNNLFYNNDSTGNGGAVRLNSGSANFNFNTWTQNSATGTTGNGGGIYNDNATVTVANSIFADNTASNSDGSAIFENSGSTTLDYLNFWNNGTNLANEGDNSFTADPLFADELFRLADGSPSIDTANPNSTLLVDFEDDFRPSDEGYDIGYDERAGCRAQRDGVVYGSIQDAVDVYVVDNLIKVSGICRGVHTIDVGGVTISQTVHITKSVVIQGGWNGEFEERYVDGTLVDPEGRGRGFYISDGISVTIEGITVTNGNATGLGGGPVDEDAGGGFYNVDGIVTLRGVHVLTGTAELGGGFYNNAGDSHLTWQYIEEDPNNDNEESYILTELAHGVAHEFGGGLYNYSGDLYVDGVWVHSNRGATGGGGLYVSDQSGIISVTNTIINDNFGIEGGGIYNAAANANYLHLTFYQNSARDAGGGFYNGAGLPSVRSTIFDSNGTDEDGTALYGSGIDADYNYYYDDLIGTITGGGAVTGTNSIASDAVPPGLLDPAAGDFHLSDDAPAADMGDPISSVLHDFEDDRRPANQGPDIGADEIVGCLAQLNGDQIFGSLQAAINAAESGDDIRVSGICSGVHSYTSDGEVNACGGNMLTAVHIDKDLTITGGWDDEFNNQEDGEYSVIDAKGLGRVVYIGQGISTTIESFAMINGAADNGAGICIDNAQPTIRHNRIYSNAATSGGGIYSLMSTPLIDGNHVYSNEATDGGGFYVTGDGSFTATIQNNFIYWNTAVDGAGVYNNSADHAYWLNTYYGNIASSEGGAFYNAGDTPDIRGSILMANQSNLANTNSGGAIYGVTTPNVDFNDYYENAPDDFGGTIADGGSNSISVDPLFYNVISGVFTITINSPVVDFDIPNMPVFNDYEDDLRPSHQGYDMGADEVGGCFAAFQHDVNTVYGSVQLAVDLIGDGGTVLVDGICYGTNSRQVSGNQVSQGLVLTKSVTIDGSWEYAEDTSTVTTTLDALNEGRVLYVANGTTVTVTNIILRQGNGTGAGNGNNGGGVFNEGILSISNAWIQENQASSGAGLYNEGTLLLDNTKVLTNTAGQNGGGMYNNTSDGTLTTIQGSEFRANDMGSSGDGGGIYHQAGRLMVNGNRIHRNGFIGSPGGNGGGIYLTSGTTADVDVRNNFIYYNEAREGGGLYNANTNGRLWHNTFYGNTATDVIGGGLASVNGSPDIRNNIVDSNNGYGIYTNNGSPLIDYNNAINNSADNIYPPGTAGINNISYPPTYVSFTEDDFHLFQGSRGEDEGDPDVSDDTNTYYVDDDIDGHMRPTNSGPDMGADEIDSCRVRVGDTIFSVLQDAIDYAETTTYDRVEIARGECRGTLLNEDTGTRQVAYISQDMEIIGSLRRIDFGGGDPHDPDVGEISTVINANDEGRVFHIASNATVSFTHIAIVNGNGFAAHPSTNDDGGGVYNPSGIVFFNQVYVCNNYAENGAGYYGGANSYTYMTGSALGTCYPVQVTENPDGSVASIRFVPNLLGNFANTHGGGAYFDVNADAELHNMGIYQNFAGLSGSGHGGGIYNNGTNNLLVNNYLYDNFAATDGGAIYNNGPELRTLHATIRNNHAGNRAGGIFNTASSFELNSSIIYSNTSTTGDGGLHYTTDPAIITHNNFNDNVPRDPSMSYGATHYTWDPGLRGFGLWRYVLSVNSPNIDQAYQPLQDTVDYDISNHYRPDGNINLEIPPHGINSDIGADEYVKDFGCEIDPDSETREVTPGSVVTYSLRIINVGNPPYTNLDDLLAPNGYTDTITITLSSQTQGWSTFEGGEVQTVELGWRDFYPNGDWATRILTVTVPIDVEVGRGETTIIECRSFSRPERFNTATIQTNVGNAGGVLVIPDVFRTVVPGQVITVEQTVINQQNQAATYLLTPSSGPRHASATLLDSLTLSPTNSITLPLTTHHTPGYSNTAILEVTILDTAMAGDIANPGLIAQDINSSVENASGHQFEILAVPGTRYVAETGTDITNCTDPIQPCATIQHAIEQAVAGDEIRVAAGTYTDYVTRTVGSDTLQQNVFIDKSLTIAGGYLATGDDPFTVQGPVTAITNAVMLDGELNRRVIYVADGITVTLSGLIIENGAPLANLSMNGSTREFGGGIYNAGADLTVFGSWLRNNETWYGAGLYNHDGALTMYSNFLSNNHNPELGEFGEGGGIYLGAGTGLIENNTFVGNEANRIGSQLTPNAITAARTGYGGGLFLDSAEAAVINNIFSNNGATVGTAIYISTTATITNSYNLYNQSGPFSTIEGGSAGAGAIFDDPQFIDWNDYHILATSPAKDTGTPTVSISQSVDIDLETRIMGLGIDIGADERTQRPGFVFEPAVLSATIDAGAPITYHHWLTNTGDFTDTYTLVMDNQVTPGGDATWSYSLQPTAITDLAPMASVPVTLVVTGGQPGYVDVTTITATSASLLTASVQDTTSISQTAGVDIEQSSAQVGLPGELVTYTHTLTNTGNGVDQFDLTYTAVPTDWIVTIDPVQTGFLTPTASIPFTVTVLVPADAFSGTMHMITVTAVTENPDASDTLTDTTTVGLNGGLTLEPDNSRNVPAGTTTVYTHTLTSYSNIEDTITLTATGSLPGWDVSITPESVVMNPLDTVEVAVTVTVPPGSGGLQHVTHVTATSTLPGVIATATNTTTVPIVTGILFTPNLTEVVFADSTVYYTHTLTNMGNLTDTFNIISNSVQGWLTDITPWPIEVAPGASVPVTAVVTVPPGTPPMTDTLAITVTSQTSVTTTATVTDTTIVIQYVEIEFIPDHNETADPGTTQVYTHTLTNNGDGTDTFDLTYSGVPPWTVTLEPASSVTLDAGETAVITANLDIPFAGSGLQNVTHITATSTVSPAISATVVNTTTVTGELVTLGVLIEPDRMAIGDPMETITYYHTVTNTGDVVDNIGLSVVSGWTATVEPTQIDDLAAGASMPVTVTITIPGTALPGEEDQALVTAVSLTNPDEASSSVTDTTRVRQNHGLLFFPDNEQTTNAGTTIVYTHTLHNTGNGADTFALTPNSASGWTTAVDSPVTLNADEATTVYITLTVPAGTEGQVDVMNVTASSVISPDFSATVVNTTTVAGVPPMADVDIEPDHSGYGTPGDVIQYIHVVTNTGTGSATFDLLADSSLRWAPTVQPTSLTLAEGESSLVTVTLTIPAGANVGARDVTIVTVTSQTDPSITDSAIDTTTVPGVYLPVILKAPTGVVPPTPTPGPSPTPTATPPACTVPTGIDLIVTEVRVEPAVPTAGTPATVFVTIRNQGFVSVAPSNNFYVDFYVDRVPTIYLIGDIEWGVQGEWLGAGQSHTFSGSYSFSGGTHQLYAQVDTDDTVDECPFEGNNTLGPVSITVSGTTNGSEQEQQQAPQTEPNDGPRQTPTPMDLSEELAVPRQEERPLSTPTPIPIGTPPPGES